MLLETIRIAIRSLGSNKLRTMLSMLGIIIGVGAVIGVISIASGSQQQVANLISSMGSNVINISPGTTAGKYGQLSKTASNIFTRELGDVIVNTCPSVKKVIPINRTSGYLIAGDTNYQAGITGTTGEYQEVNNYNPESGLWFSEYDMENSENVIVLGSELVTQLYNGVNPLGQKIRFYSNNHHYVFEIIGIMEEKGKSFAGNLDYSAYIPISTYQNLFGDGRYISNFMAQAASSEEATEAVEQIEYLLAKSLGDEDKFNINSQDQALETYNQSNASMKLMLTGIAAISLLVGGIGIMNIMLVSVTERTREIGIRKALGAKRKHILSQFLAEALTLSCGGGILGVIIGGFGAYWVAEIGDWPFVFSLPSVWLAFGFSLLIGVFFGIYPAVKASKLDPVKALSYE
jgi:putative ABC transport system permease protein